MIVKDLFPPCPRFPCPLEPHAPPGHKHILEAQQEMMDAKDRYILSAGGYGSGKSVAAAVIVHLLMLAIPGNRGIIGRQSYPKLRDTSQRLFMDVLQRSKMDWDERERRDGWANHIIYPNGSEVFFRETTDPGKWLGPEYGVFWLDEVIEMLQTVFTGLMGRLRLPAAGPHRKGLLTTNPPPPNHWVTKIFGESPGIKEIEVIDLLSGKPAKITFRRIGSTSLDNPALPEDYVASLQSVLPPSEVERVLMGKTTFSYEGKPVYTPPFSFGKHVGMPEPIKDSSGLLRPMIRGWDFGYHVPAVGWHQHAKCHQGRVHWYVLAEYIGQNIEAEDLARVVLAKSRELFPNNAGWLDIGDAAGAQISDRGPGPIVRLAQPRPKGFGIRFRYRKIPSVDPGVALIRKVLAEPLCKCGQPILMVHRRCPVTIDMLAGGYHYPTPRPGREESPKPVKDGLYDNVADQMRYVGELAFRIAVTDQGMMDRLTQHTPVRQLWKLPGSLVGTQAGFDP